ncbi:TAXI family TRAP transporter solute-binding subunit, partial [Epibacterium ulvae]|uniref:TAXI family TRAP transporter solute-binding subunit n=1 Tax=Epibacterium ulvae TaxID=1156985 RepID=UPI002042417B
MALVKSISGALFASALIAGPVAAQDPSFFRIGTGGAGGTYFPIGGTIANGISNPPGSRPCDEGGQCGVPGLIAIAQSTTASVFNNAAVQNGELEAGLAAADVTRSMFLGEGKFEGKPHPNLRIIANLFPEDLHLVMPAGESIDSLADLEGMRVGIAQAGSGTQVVVVVTHHHPDHVGLAGWFQSQYGAELVTTRTAWLFSRMLTLDEQDVWPRETLAYYRSAGMDPAIYA